MEKFMPYQKTVAKKRWTISKMKDYKKFCGWDTLQRLIDNVKVGMKGKLGETLVKDEQECEEARAIIATTFETGARIAEVLGQDSGELEGLKVSSFDLVGNVKGIVVAFDIAKRWEKIGELKKFKATDNSRLRWNTEEEARASGRPYREYDGQITKRVKKVRSITIPREEPLLPVMISWVREKEHEGKDTKLFSLPYNRFYRILTSAGKKIGEDFPPHRLRAERATQLALQYGCPDSELTEWFEWERGGEMAHDYTTVAGLTLERMTEGAKKLFGKVA
jgi:integrase